MNGSALENVLAPWNALAATSDHLRVRPLGVIERDGQCHELPGFVFVGPRGGGDPVRIGFFAGIHGDEPAGSWALVRFARRLAEKPDLAQGYELFFYPVCNPSGFLRGTRTASNGLDLNRQFWRQSVEPEVVLLEREIRSRAFHGLVSLHADDTSAGLYGFVRGAVLTRGLLEPALTAAGAILPRNLSPVIDGFAARDGIIAQCYEGILTSPPELDPAPFEIILETPGLAPQVRQIEALEVALETILVEYQKLLAFAANL